MPSRRTHDKDELIAAAIDLFAAKGYQGTGMSDLERSAGIGRGALYYHIGNKEALLFEISMNLLRDSNTFARDVVQSSRPPDEKVAAIGSALIDLVSERRAQVTVFFREWQWLSGEHRRQVLESRDEFEGYILDIVREGTESGTFRPVANPTVLVKGMLGMFNYSYLWLRDTGPLSPEEVAQELITFVLQGLLDLQAPVS